MTIKKPIKVTKAPATATSTAPGGAAIASRLRLDTPDASKKVAGATIGLKVAFGAAIVSLIVTGVLVYMLWKHWEFLMPA